MSEFDFEFSKDDIMLPDVHPQEREIFPDMKRYSYLIDMSEFTFDGDNERFPDSNSLQRHMDILLGRGQSRVYIFTPIEYIKLGDERKIEDNMKHDIAWLLTGNHFTLRCCHICVEFNLDMPDVRRWLEVIKFLAHHCSVLHGFMNVYKDGKKVVEHVSTMYAEDEIDAVLKGRYVIREDYRSLRTESPNGTCVVNKEYPKNFSYVYLTLKDNDILRNYPELYDHLDCIQHRIRKIRASKRMVLAEEYEHPVSLLDASEI